MVLRFDALVAESVTSWRTACLITACLKLRAIRLAFFLLVVNSLSHSRPSNEVSCVRVSNHSPGLVLFAGKQMRKGDFHSKQQNKRKCPGVN